MTQRLHGLVGGEACHAQAREVFGDFLLPSHIPDVRYGPPVDSQSWHPLGAAVISQCIKKCIGSHVISLSCTADH